MPVTTPPRMTRESLALALRAAGIFDFQISREEYYWSVESAGFDVSIRPYEDPTNEIQRLKRNLTEAVKEAEKNLQRLRKALLDPGMGAGSCNWMEVEPNVTRCKHGSPPCDKCGTSNRRDVVHTTVRGKGKVARIQKD